MSSEATSLVKVLPDGSTFTLSTENYYSNEAGMLWCSCSQLKSFMDCEAKALAELRGEFVRDTSDAMLLGSYVDSMLLTPEDTQKFLFNHPEMFSSRGNHGLLAKYAIGDTMVARAKRDKLFMKTLEGNHQEILTGEIFGTPFKARLDTLNLERGFIDDLKTTSDPTKEFWNPEKGHKENFAQHFKYDLQAAIYTELVYQKYGVRLPFFLSVVSSQAHPRLTILEIDEESQANALAEAEELIRQIPMLKSGEIAPSHCCMCDYCADTLPAQVHDWLNREEA